MPAFYPIPVGRSSDLMVQQRLLAQLSTDQLDLVKLQTQISTGRRISLPSEDAPAARRAMGLQRLLEQQKQVRTNLATSQSYLAATDNAISGVSHTLTEIRGLALSAVNTTSGEQERAAAAQSVRAALQQLLDVGNRQFRGRYLFSGSSTSTRPFETQGDYIAYQGNTGRLRSYADSDILYETNVPGTEIFGALTTEAQSHIPFEPHVTAGTRLADLRGGAGITIGSFTIRDGTNSSTVDLRGAETLGDVARLIEQNPPAGRKLTARVTDSGLMIEIDAAGGGDLQILEVGNGTTAAELGIRRTTGVGTGPLVGEPLRPRLRPNDLLENILGTRASAVVRSDNNNNNLLIEAKSRGTDDNGVKIQFVDDSLLQAAPGLEAGNETVAFGQARSARAALAFSGAGNDLILEATQTGDEFNNISIVVAKASGLGDAANVSYDSTQRRLTITVDDANQTSVAALAAAINTQGMFTAIADPSAGDTYNAAATISQADADVIEGNTGNSGGDENTVFVHLERGATTANDVVAALQASTAFSARFTVQLDAKDTPDASFAGTGLIDVDLQAVTAGGGGEEIDLASGLQIVNAGQTHTIDFTGAETVEDLLNILNRSSAGVLAQLNEQGDGITVRSRFSGADFQIGENGGLTATHLGIRTLDASTSLASLNYGRGVHSASGVDFTIKRSDGVELGIDISSAATLGDVIDLINQHPLNQGVGAVAARLVEFGNGIELVADDPLGTGVLSVTPATQSRAAADLGLIGADQIDTKVAETLAISASGKITLAPPFQLNTGIQLTAAQPGTLLNGVRIVLEDALAGDTADVAYDASAKELRIRIDATATTANTVLAAINTYGVFTAELDATTDPTNDGTGVLGQVGEVGLTSGGAASVLKGRDVNPQEVKGLFNTLRRLDKALQAGDVLEIQRAAEMLDDDISQVNFVRGELGAKMQGLDSLSERLDSEEIELKANLSTEIDTDFAAAVSELTARQAAMEASLRLMGQLFQMTLLNFL